MIRPLADIGRWIEGLVSPAPQVRFGVDQARHASATMTATDLGPAAADAAGAGPGAVSAEPPAAPAPGHPDRADQVDSATQLLIHHRVGAAELGSLDALACHGCFWRGDDVDEHCAHQARLVVDMLRADARMSAATNKFRQ